MMCPNGHAALQITERNGVEIDYCPECRGVWLDRGELDKILDRAEAALRSTDSLPGPSGERSDDRRNQRDEYDHRSSQGRPKKKSSFLSELFDF